MPEVKLDPAAVKKSLRVAGSPQHTAKQFGVSSSTIYRFMKDEGIDIKFLRNARKHGTWHVASALENIGVSRSEIARRLAVSTAYISQILDDQNRQSIPANCPD